jgi:hypothetical protein
MKISVSIARDQEMNAEVDNELAVDELAEQFSNPLNASSGNPVPLNSTNPTFVLIPGFGGYQADVGSLAAAIAADTASFPGGDVNILIATWQGSTAGPTIDGVTVPWMASLHIDTAGTDLGDLLNDLDQHGEIAFNTTTVVGEGMGNEVGNQAARIVGGLENAIAFNPASALDGDLPANLTVYYQNSITYETSSLFGAQLNLAQTNQTLNTGNLNDPVLQQTYGVPWLLGQILLGNDAPLYPSTGSSPNAIPPGNDPVLLTSPVGLVVTSSEVLQITSIDPNSIIGPKGSGSNGMVPIKQPLAYTVQFTNLPTAQAPAQQVVIQQNLPSTFDWGSFRLSSFGFDGQTYSVPANLSYYQTTLDLTGYDVNVTATIDESTGIATCIFTTIDPTTGEMPLSPTIGLLPPDNATGAREGFVSYTIMANPSDPTGTVLSAQAAVTFDGQPQLSTPVILNTVDAGTGLTSSVAALPAVENSTQFGVSWSGTDANDASGVSNYTIYVSNNGSPYTAWLTNTTLTSAPYVGQDGHTNSFYSVANDYVGNSQPTPTAAQATTTVDATPPSSSVESLPQYSPGSFTVDWSGRDSNGIGIANYTIYVSDNGGAFTPWLTVRNRPMSASKGSIPAPTSTPSVSCCTNC